MSVFIITGRLTPRGERGGYGEIIVEGDIYGVDTNGGYRGRKQRN